MKNITATNFLFVFCCFWYVLFHSKESFLYLNLWTLREGVGKIFRRAEVFHTLNGHFGYKEKKVKQTEF